MRTNFTRARWIAGIALFAAPAGAAELEFAGYIRVSGGMRFVVSEATQRKSSEWLEIGDRFSGYTVTAFDVGTETLTVTKANESIRLILRSAAIQSASSMENWTEAALLHEMEANRKLLAGVNAELNDRTRALEEAEKNRETSAKQEELMKVWMDKLLLRNLLSELVQLQSDLILFVQMRREDDENAIKARVRVTALMHAMTAQNFRAPPSGHGMKP